MSSIFFIQPGTQFKITDEKVLKMWPQFKNLVLTLSVARWSGQRLFIQYNKESNGTTQCSTLKLLEAPEIEVVGWTKKIEKKTLSMFLEELKYREDKRPAEIKIDVNGSVDTYKIEPKFWEQNPRNIKLKGLRMYGSSYSVPGSAIVI